MPGICSHMIIAKEVSKRLNIDSDDFIRGNLLSDIIDLKEEEDRIVITKSLNKNISLLERFSNYKGNSLAKEFVWDEPKGKEIW